jgi:EmrB/QacA subfamily drug resistance transporter
LTKSELETSEATSQKRNTLIAATAASFLAPFMASSVNLAIPSIGMEFGAGAYELGWVVTSYLLASAAFLLPFGKAADILGRRRIFLTGISCFSVTAFLCGFAPSIEMLIGARLLQGISASMIFGTSIAILISVFPPKERGQVLGINSASVYVGLSLGPVLGGGLNHYLGWQSIFFANGAVGLLTLFFVRRLKGEWLGTPGEKFDFVGAFLYAASVVFLLYGISSLSSSPWAAVIIALGAVTFGVFVAFELRQQFPLFNFRLFLGNRTFTFSNIATLINYSASFAVGYLVSIFLQTVKGFDSQTAGIVLLAQPVIMTVLSPIAGKLSDTVSPRKLASAGMAVIVVSLLAFSQIQLRTDAWYLVVCLMIFGAGLAFFASPNINAVMGAVDHCYYGVASSALGTMRLTGQAVSMAIVTVVMAAYFGNAELSKVVPANLTAATTNLFLIFSALSFVGIFASLAGRREEKSNC